MTRVDATSAAADGQFKGRSVVVTGAASGLGLAYARDLAARGANLVVNDLNEAMLVSATAEIDAQGQGRVVAVPGSVSEWSTAALLVDECVQAFGEVQGFVNNAGVLHVADPTDDDEERSRRTFEVNALGAYFCGLHALRQMLIQGSGSLVNVASGALDGFPGMAAYGASKAAVVGMTRSWALDVAGSGVRCNVLMPVANTTMSRSAETWVTQVAGDWPAGAVSPATIAPVVSYLVSDLSQDLNGEIVRADGQHVSLAPDPGPRHEVPMPPGGVSQLEELSAALATMSLEKAL